MDIQARIKKISQYFKLFNIAENVAYVLIKLPKNWTIPETLSDYKIKATYDKENDGYYFFSDLNENKNGVESIFDAVDFVLDFNKEIEERVGLFKELAAKLKEIIYSEPIEKVKLIEFTFKEEKRPKKAKNSKKQDSKKKPEVKKEDKPVKIEERVELDLSDGPKVIVNKEEDTPLLEYAKNLVGE